MSERSNGMPVDTAAMEATAEVMGDPELVADLDEASAEIAAEGTANDPWRAKQELILALSDEIVENQKRLLLAAETVVRSDVKQAAEFRQLAGAWGRLGGGF